MSLARAGTDEVSCVVADGSSTLAIPTQNATPKFIHSMNGELKKITARCDEILSIKATAVAQEGVDRR